MQALTLSPSLRHWIHLSPLSRLVVTMIVRRPCLLRLQACQPAVRCPAS